MRPAPYHHDVAEGPNSTEAFWLEAADGVRLRLALWPEAGQRGTVLLFPGRTEYVEKYGRTSGDLNRMGFAVISIDWRGQGLADRALDDRNAGHVMRFLDYQMDVDALISVARERQLPEPWFLVAHSMGGAIGLRALMNRLPVNAALFSAPMWGIGMAGYMRPVAWSLSWVARLVGRGHHYTPGTHATNYAAEALFDDNVLTSDAEMFAYMQRQISEYPDLALGGPSLHWLHEALRETRAMARLPSPDCPTLTVLGSNERVVDPAPIHARMARWPGGRLKLIEGGEHEVLMEQPTVRERVNAEMDRLFAG